MIFGDKAVQIEKFRKKRNSAKIIALLDDKKPEIRTQAIQALGDIGDEKSINTLILLLSAPDPAVRIEVIKSMGKTANQVIKSHLQHMVQVEKDPAVVKAIRESIALIPNKN